MTDFKMKCSTRRQIDMAITVFFIVFALTPWAKWLTSEVNLSAAFAPPGSAAYPLGADNLGRDLLVRLSGAISKSVVPLWACVSAAALAGILSVLGFVAIQDRFPGGVLTRTIALLMKVISFVASIPVFILVFALVVTNEQTGLSALIGPIAIVIFSRFIAVVLNLIARDRLLSYWQAGVASGWTQIQLVWRYGVSRAWRSVLVGEFLFSLTVVVSIESALSYLGMGIAEPDPSFGNMLASHFDDYLRGRFWVLTTIAASFFLTAYVPIALRRSFLETNGVRKLAPK